MKKVLLILENEPSTPRFFLLPKVSKRELRVLRSVHSYYKGVCGTKNKVVDRIEFIMHACCLVKDDHIPKAAKKWARKKWAKHQCLIPSLTFNELVVTGSYI